MDFRDIFLSLVRTSLRKEPSRESVVREREKEERWHKKKRKGKIECLLET